MVKVLFCCNLSYVTLGQTLVEKRKKKQCCKLFYFEMNVIYWAVLHSARLVISRSNLSGQRMRSRTRLEGRGFKKSTRRLGKLLDLFLPSHWLKKKKKITGVAVMSIVIELLVLLDKKNVYCIDDILPKKAKKTSKKMYFSL